MNIKELLQALVRGEKLSNVLLKSLALQGLITVRDVTNNDTPPGERELLFIALTEKGRRELAVGFDRPSARFLSFSLFDFEANPNWQASARRSDGKQVAVMRGQSGPHYYIYVENEAPERSSPDTAKPYSADQIREMFANGRLVLLRGSMP
jgi:hypothetical protein